MRANPVPIKKAGEMGTFAAFSFDGLILGQCSLIFSPIAKNYRRNERKKAPEGVNPVQTMDSSYGEGTYSPNA
jgi:hypothetical protein